MATVIKSVFLFRVREDKTLSKYLMTSAQRRLLRRHINTKRGIVVQTSWRAIKKTLSDASTNCFNSVLLSLLFKLRLLFYFLMTLNAIVN